MKKIKWGWIENNEEHKIDEEIVNNEGSEIEEQDNPNGFENDVDQSDDSIFLLLKCNIYFQCEYDYQIELFKFEVALCTCCQEQIVAMFSTEPVLSAGSKST